MFSKKFICASHKYSTYTEFCPAPYFRKTFTLAEKPEKCTVTVTGLGFYELFINGSKITKGLIAPYISNPDHIVYYDCYDITKNLLPGKNVLGIQLGNGMQNAPGGQIWDFDKAPFRSAPCTAFAIEIKKPDGTTQLIEADESVKTAPSPVLFDDLRCGCFYDARNEINGWAEPDFDDSFWSNALRAPTARGEARLCKAEPIQTICRISPVSVRKCTLAEFEPRGDVVKEANPLPSKERVGYLYDFGRNSAGIERLKIRGERGQQVDMQFCEFVNTDGKADFGNINFYPDGYAQRDIYILSGRGEEVFEPVFTYHGFRYIFVTGITEEQAVPGLLDFKICSSSVNENAKFRCSDKTADILQAMTVNSILSNFYYFPTDCPHREKNGWTGDAALSCESALINFTVEDSYREWLNNIRKAQAESGALPGIIPTDKWGYHWGNGPAWDAALTYLPYYTYIMRGNKIILEENAHAIFSYCEYLSRKRTKRGTLEFGLGDWCPVTSVKAPLELTDSITAMSILEKAAYIFSELRLWLQKEFCEKLYAEIRTAVRKYLIDWGSFTAAGRCQTSQAMAIYYNVFDEAEKKEAFKVLLKIIERSDDHIDFGILGAKVLFRVLADYGEAELAYKMITRPDYPSYGHFIEQGLTALPECFFKDGARPDSLNHHMFGDISAWFIEYIAGIRPNPYRKDANEILLAPCFIKKLTYTTAFYDTPDGRISVKWERTPLGIKLRVDKNDDIHGEIRLPEGFVFTEDGHSTAKLENGEYLITDLDGENDYIIEL